jgi:hypothetical protein
VADIEKYLNSGLIKGIGPVMAKRIVKKFEKETLYRSYLKSSSPQMPMEDIEMIAIIFPGKVIIVAGGKLTIIWNHPKTPLPPVQWSRRIRDYP